MTPLRQRRIEDLQLRGLAERTQERYGRAVRPRAEHSPTSPEPSAEEALRPYVLSLKHVKHASRSASPMALCGSKFFSAHTLPRPWPTLPFVRPPQDHKLPVLLSLDAGHPLRRCGRLPRSRACLRTLSACGLPLQAGTHLQVPDSARARMGVHVRHGQGAQERSVPLPQRTLPLLRQSWRTHRPPGWLLPAPGRGGLGLSTASTPMPRPRVPDAWRAA
jgi:integrase/recombinase XerD